MTTLLTATTTTTKEPTMTTTTADAPISGKARAAILWLNKHQAAREQFTAAAQSAAEQALLGREPSWTERVLITAHLAFLAAISKADAEFRALTGEEPGHGIGR